LKEKASQELQEMKAKYESKVQKLIPSPSPQVTQKPTQQPSATQVLTSIIDKFLMSSKCATEKQQKEYLMKLLGNK
jgi:hypothetical protein